MSSSRAAAQPLLPLLLLACATTSFDGAVVRKADVTYALGALPADWKRVSIEGADVAFTHASGGTLLANATCADTNDASLAVLTNHLLFGLTALHDEVRTPFTLDGREALSTEVAGELDGVPVRLGLVVVKKDGCAFDLQRVAAPAAFERHRADFDRFVAGLAVRGTR